MKTWYAYNDTPIRIRKDMLPKMYQVAAEIMAKMYQDERRIDTCTEFNEVSPEVNNKDSKIL